jgi:hypothetical protein
MSGVGACIKSGNKGRIGVYELLMIDDGVRELLVRGHNPDQLRHSVMNHGFQTIAHDAFQKACQDLICPEEIIQLGVSVAMAMEDGAEPEEPPVLPAASLPGAERHLAGAGARPS